MKLIRLLILTILFTNAATAQLVEFNLQLSKTDETCLGNGSITVNATNTNPSATLLYKVYKLPNVTTAVSIQTANVFNSLSSGTYKVVAIQALGNQTNSQEKNVTINNNIVPFNYSVTSSNQNCASGGSIIVNATSGVAAQYEIISGPVTRPLQSSNIFSNLPGGNYNIRVYNNCGVAKVKTYTLALITSVLEIAPAYYTEVSPALCDSTIVNNLISPSAGTINYPLSVQFKLIPMTLAGQVITINQTYSTGDSDSLVVSATVPRYLTDSYNYELRVTDNCNSMYEKLDNVVDPSIDMQLQKGHMLCGERFLKISAYNHIAPFTVEFIDAPAGFNPATFNANGLGPFYDETISYGGEQQAVPFGNYVVRITDACGRIAERDILIEFEDLQPTVRGNNNGCFSLFGRIRIHVPEQQIVSASIIATTANYNVSLPQNIAAFINNQGRIVMEDMPIGTYTVTFTDDCGFSYTVNVVVPPFVEKDFAINTLPGCEPGFGSVTISSGNGDLTSVAITSAPAMFGNLSYNATADIAAADGAFYIDNLPQGSYTFVATDICGVEKTFTIDVIGYAAPQNTIEFTPNCGSFTVKVSDASNGVEAVRYWLQKLNPVTGQWGHPSSNNPYVEGAGFTSGNSLRLTNNIARNNLTQVGQFRIVKTFETYSRGTAEKAICISVLGEFNFNDAFSIANAYNLACTGSPNDIFIEAQGYDLTYKIEKKDGVVFVVDNGTDNVFKNLDAAIYIFSIEDGCGNKLTKEVNVGELPSIADAIQPSDMHICVEEGSGASNYTFVLTDQNPAILGNKPASMYTITYHSSQEDADAGNNPLPANFISTSNGQMVYARLINNHIALCYGTTSFALFIGEYPEALITTEGTICNNGLLTLTASAGFDSYLWSTGETTRTISVAAAGTYTVVVENSYGTEKCGAAINTEIFESSEPEIVKVDTSDWTRDDNSITVYANGIGQYEYSLDGITFQESNVFTNLQPGVFQVYVRDAHGCGMDTKEVVLMHYPNFFTPNGDGVHDKWRIKLSYMEPNMEITVMDRYGKVVTSFDSKSEGWDGTLNGAQLPSTDYWFVVKREDGRELRGHFAMLR